jgi:hypothetical protein
MYSEPRTRRIRHGRADSTFEMETTDTVATSPERVEMAVRTSHEDYPNPLRDESVVCIGTSS